MRGAARVVLALTTAISLLLQPSAAMASEGLSATPGTAGSDTRIYLSDGSVIMGELLERSQDLIILRVDEQIFTFDPQTEVDRIVTLNSLGAGARTITVTEFPYISFLGGTQKFRCAHELRVGPSLDPVDTDSASTDRRVGSSLTAGGPPASSGVCPDRVP